MRKSLPDRVAAGAGFDRPLIRRWVALAALHAMASPSWPQTEALITATFESPIVERERFLHESCTDPALRDGLIALIHSRNRDAGRGDGSANDDESVNLSIGSPVGPYIVLDRIGRGGMGEVFLAKDPRLDRAVALKCVLSGQLAAADLRNRIINEARAAARITHPGIAAVYDVVEHDGRTFIVMEYVQGQSLAALLRREPLPIERVIEIGWQLADALSAAHRVGIIHRDLKPGNVQVTPDGSVKILDFGIAMAIVAATTDRTRTDSGSSRPAEWINQGTPPYMSPEQLLGLGVDQRADLFSLAVVLFEMATGRRPWESSNPFEILLASVRRGPRADDIDPRVPASLAEVIHTGLSADPALRYQTAAEMAYALAHVRQEVAGNENAPSDTRRRTRGLQRWLVVGSLSLAIPIMMGVLGWMMTAAFNGTLGRSGAFAAEPFRSNFVWSARSLVAPFVYATLTVGVLWGVRFVLQVLTLSRSADTAERRVLAGWQRLAARLSLHDALVFESGLVTLGVLTLAIVAWHFNELIRAWGSNISTAPAEAIFRLGPANEGEKVLYRAVLTVLLLLFAGGLGHTIRLRLRRPVRRWGSFAASVAIVVSILLLNEVPYRILWHNQAPRISYNGIRCYVIGNASAERLIFCPDASPPRNRIVRDNDPLMVETGVTESIFSPAGVRP
jgi:serine/threonine protein kinase